ncbi:MATE family efflux transporter [Roseibium litorale]|uniref:Multidrug export protein MepA n=1 Tax=Roseibium litorale TaxID=2803841 RepID=A0ABR9CV00_9HYPH|nr:MATE family efflux transporter [Roseibium litorale]MBD8894344.1 MATE family efflux transporter [Roseibium litorale]
MTSGSLSENRFTHGPLPAIFIRTAGPIVFVMTVNGLLTVVDAIFLGIYNGPDALSAVTLIFPVYMLIVALSTLVSSGMSSILARRLGSGDQDGAQTVFAGAHGLALVISLGLMGLFLILGKPLVLLIAGGNGLLAGMGWVYLGIMVAASPVLLFLSLNTDALRNEGLAGRMAMLSLIVSLANILFNYMLIGWLGLGVAGSALGTALAQMLALGLVAAMRLSGQTPLGAALPWRGGWGTGWRGILALGLPQSLSFIGIALVSASILGALQLVGGAEYAVTTAAYGIVTRIMTFTFLPLLAMSMTLQSMVGNNFGAGLRLRSDACLRLILVFALLYGAAVEISLILSGQALAHLFVQDPHVTAAVGRILPVMVAMYFLAGPLMMVGAYFQALGEAPRAAVISLAKPYFFAIPSILILPRFFGEQAVWLSMPLAEMLLAGVTLVVLVQSARAQKRRLGLFTA